MALLGGLFLASGDVDVGRVGVAVGQLLGEGGDGDDDGADLKLEGVGRHPRELACVEKLWGVVSSAFFRGVDRLHHHFSSRKALQNSVVDQVVQLAGPRPHALWDGDFSFTQATFTHMSTRQRGTTSACRA